ncbi:expressed unknown protein [Seminavis robusta]|uniref:Orc1-like AAA ATPase domain-containing protein n=1 Tax=Seminavis robusta TaxID=568900 RepID=A0A9N8DB67_9STRA|nr:expressed unknown protein [Seminavis robusta]|eukprot:Sro17_g012360.1 n/a (1123) ;mRNA; r:85326-88867
MNDPIIVLPLHHHHDNNHQAESDISHDEELPAFREASHSPPSPATMDMVGMPPLNGAMAAKMTTMGSQNNGNMKMMMMKRNMGPLNRDDSLASTVAMSEMRSSSSTSSQDVIVRVLEDPSDGDWLCQLQHRLYSREEEEAILLRAYQHNARSSSSFRSASSNGELCLISGAQGLGKTRLARTLEAPVKEDGGFFLSAKFDQVKEAKPIRIFAEAFTEFTHAVLSRGPEMVQSMRQEIREALGDELGVLLCGIPKLEQIVGTPDEPRNGQFTCQMAKRFVFALHDLIHVICKSGPVVFLFDDMQWMDKCSGKILKWFLTGLHNKRLFIVATCDDSVGPCSPVSNLLRELEDENHQQIFQIEVSQKPCSAIWNILTTALPMPKDKHDVLAQLVCAQTQGNPLYILEFLRWLSDNGLLMYDAAQGTCTLLDEDVRLAINSCRLGDFLVDVLEQLPTDVQHVLRVAACFGNDVKEDFLKVVLPQDPITDHLHDATSRGILVFDQDTGYSFRHDGLQQAALALIPPQEKEAMHYFLGRKLLKGLSEAEREKHMFLILGQLQLAKNFIQDRQDKESVAMLCLSAGRASARASAFGAAAGYFEFGIELTDAFLWRGDYSLKLALYNAAAEMELTIANFERVHELIEIVFANVPNCKDRLQSFNTLIYAYGVQDQQHLAVETGIKVLSELDETFPVKNCMTMLRSEMRKVRGLLRGKSNAQIMRMEMVKDEGKLAALQILNIMFMNAAISRPKFAPFIQLKAIQITMMYGLSNLSSFAFASYGMLCTAIGRFDEANRYGQLALDLLQKFQAKEYAPRVFAAVYGCIIPWQRPIRETIEPLKRAAEIGSSTGDMEFAVLNFAIYAGTTFYTDSKLPVVSNRIGDVITMMTARGQDSMITMIKPFHQLTLHLMGMADDPTKIELDESFKHAEETKNVTSLVCLRLQQMMISYLFGDYGVAGKMVAEIEKLTFPPPGIDAIFCKFFVGMTHLQNARRLKGMQRFRCLNKAKKAIKALKNWSRHSPHNCLPMKFLLEAELASYQGKNKKSYEKYTASTALAVDASFKMIEAMSHEHAGRHLYGIGDESLAAASFKKALSAYKDWGAVAKLKRLQEEVQPMFAGSSVQFEHVSLR